MFLQRLILVNWGNIPQLEFEFGPINLFSGGNGSGKTTAADAIQTLMTAAHENLFNYNPGQDETTQKGRGGKQVRTLASYVLGCDDGSFARPYATDGYIAGVFRPTDGESAEPFSALMCMRAHLDTAGKQKQARLDELQFLIVPNEALTLGHLVRSYPDGKHVVTLDTIADLLKKEFGKKAVEQYDKKGAYLRRLYAALRGRRDAINDREAKHAARTLANFMAYKPVKSITDFVAQEILMPKDLGDAIRNVSELMKTIHHMEADTRAICESITTLGDARDLASRYIDTWQERATSQYTAAQHRLLGNQKAYLSAKTAQQKTADASRHNEQAIAACDSERLSTHGRMVRLEAERQGISVLKTKDELEATIRRANHELGEQARPLAAHSQALERNKDASEHLLTCLTESSIGVAVKALEEKQVLTLVRQCSQSAALVIHPLLSQDWVGDANTAELKNQAERLEANHRALAQALHQARGQAPSIRDQVAELKSSLDRKRQDLQQKTKQKQKDVQRLQASRVSYPAAVEAALAAIRKHCPAADPQVLCDFVEVTDPRWQMALEGYIGGARFSILVAPDYEADAIRAVRALPDGKKNRARVIQGAKACRDAERLTLPAGSIVDVLHFNHKIAEYYLRASYGSVLRVETAEELRHTARGITPEGVGSGNYSMWRCDLDDSELVFGEAARARALAAKLRELDELQLAANQAEQDCVAVTQAFAQVEAIQPVPLVATLNTVLAAHQTITEAEDELKQLDVSGFAALEEQLAKLRKRFSELDGEHRALVEEAGRLKELARQHERKVKELACARDSFSAIVESLEQTLHQLSQWQPDFDLEQALSGCIQAAAQAPHEFDFGDDIATLAGQLEQAERALYQAIVTHNQRAQPSDAVVYNLTHGERHGAEFFQAVLGLKQQVGLIHNRLKNNVLVDKYEKLTQLKDHFTTAFVANLCHSIYQAINEGERTLKDLNEELEYHQFGADRERFYFGFAWVPEFRDYWRFFKEVIDLPNLGDGQSLFDAELGDKAQAVRDHLLRLLLDPDEQVGLRELARISDYRNYRHYEIYKEPAGKAPIALSQYGTGSGGQLETPAYIIRAAAVTSAFRFNEGSAHLRMVLVDEAFSKMDETRSREVIAYLTERLGLQLIFIMPTSKSGPFMDLISHQFVFSKCPTTQPLGELHTRVLVDRKHCNTDKIQALWANHRKTIRQQGLLDFMEGIA